jgi:hypothetical protein
MMMEKTGRDNSNNSSVQKLAWGGFDRIHVYKEGCELLEKRKR